MLFKAAEATPHSTGKDTLMSTNVSRRNFVKGAGVAAAATAATTMVSSAQALDAVTAQTPDWLGAAPEIDEAQIAETLECEVLVCGFGTGGVPLALSAAQNGVDVIVVERDAEGAQMSLREDLGAINSRYQQASFAEFPEFEISEKDAVEDIVRYANGYCNYDLIKLWAQRSGEAIDWVADQVEATGKFYMDFEGGIGTPGGRDRAYATGHSPQKTEAAGEEDNYSATMRALAQEAGAKVRFETRIVKLEQGEDGRVTGAICEDTAAGTYLRINASKGVALATGGYSTNTAMMEAL